MIDIKNYQTFAKIKPINKGWSSDKKYYIETTDNKQLLLRVADISQYDRKNEEFEMMKQLSAVDIPMSQPVDFGICDNGKSVYTLLTWIEGQDAEDVLPLLTETQQYTIGLQAGKILQKINSITVNPPSSDWANAYGNKIDKYIENYRNCGMSFENEQLLIDYINANRLLMQNRPMCLTHGDFHVGNLILSENNALSVIDFNRFNTVDPFHSFGAIVFSAVTSPPFAMGQINGYFEGDPPEIFWKLLSLYLSAIAVNALPWSIPYGEDEITFAKQQIANILLWYDNMQNVVPSWYIKDFYFQYIDDIPCKLKSPFDFSFLSRYGKVFKVFDGQDSGNICFGVEKDDKKYFVKFAGAPSKHGCVSTDVATLNLKRTESVYKDLAHDSLIKLISAEEIGGGYAMVFDWVNGECPHPMYPLSRQQFMTLSLQTKVKIFKNIMKFHAFVASKGYVAIDFYLGSILYDFENEKTIICDIDFYAKTPYTNEMGRMWGSSRFMSTEEFKKGAIIDEITNVYTMGATAFALFSDSDRTPDKWLLSKEWFEVVSKATNDDRIKRQHSILELINEWNNAKDM